MKYKDNIKSLIKSGESETVEFKTSFSRETIESLVAFANKNGGRVVIGVSDDGLIKGVNLGKETLNDWLSQIKMATSPSIIPEIEKCKLDGKVLVTIEIDEYPIKPVNYKGKYFQRISTSNHQMSLSQISNMYMKSLQVSWDSYEATNHKIDSLSIPKIENFIEQVNQSGRFNLDPSPILSLEKLKFIVNGQPTWASVLLFAETPMRHHIHIGRFKTPSLIIDDRQITDTLFEAVEQAMKFIVSHISVAFTIDGNLKRKETFAYPLTALREALLNAVVHRDYANSSDIQIKIFDEKITIYSPGKLYGGLKMKDLNTDNYSSILRNKLIAEAFYLTKNIEKYGSGFIRIRKELESYPGFTFSAEELNDGVFLTFSFGGVKDTVGGVNSKTGGVKDTVGGVNHKIGGVKDTVGGVNSKTGGVKDDDKSKEKAVKIIKKTPGLKAAEIAGILNTSKRTIERILKQLKEEKTIEFKGSPKTGGYFKI